MVFEFDFIPDIYGLDWIRLVWKNWPVSNSACPLPSSLVQIKFLQFSGWRDYVVASSSRSSFPLSTIFSICSGSQPSYIRSLGVRTIVTWSFRLPAGWLAALRVSIRTPEWQTMLEISTNGRREIRPTGRFNRCSLQVVVGDIRWRAHADVPPKNEGAIFH